MDKHSGLIGPVCKLQGKRSVVNTDHFSFFTVLELYRHVSIRFRLRIYRKKTFQNFELKKERIYQQRSQPEPRPIIKLLFSKPYHQPISSERLLR